MNKETWAAVAGGALAVAWGLSRRSYSGLAVAVGGGCLACWAATRRWQVFTQAIGANMPPRTPQPQTGTDPGQRQWYPPATADLVEEASMDSFPASDPPSYMSSSATPSQRSD